MTEAEFRDRLGRVAERIDAACARSGRDPRDVTVVAVTKGHPAAVVATAIAGGVREIGENRVQELEEKVAAIGRGAARWHLIGHLQRNKVRRSIDLFDLLHSVDSIRLARKLSEEAVSTGRPVDALIQVNVSGEATKGGIGGPSALSSIGEICALPGLRIQGLMTMAPFTDDARTHHRVFAATRRLAEEAGAALPRFEARHLSMGMSGDFEAAIEEGSTLVRLGTVLFGERDR